MPETGDNARARRGRPSRLTPALQEAICQRLRAGCYVDVAASSSGIRVSAVHDWLAKGRVHKQGIYREFFVAVEKAKADAETSAVAHISAAARHDWRAAAWFLEHARQHTWGGRVRVEIDDKRNAAESTEALLAGIYGADSDDPAAE